MTHIETGIQEDALKVLDVLLDHYPALLAARPALLLTNFLELISHRSTGGGARKGQEGKGRSWALSVNPNRNVTGQQWRLTVLFRYSYTCNKLAVSYWCVHIFFWRDLCVCVFSRLWRFLQAVVEERRGEEGVACVSGDMFSVLNGQGGANAPLELNWEELTYKKGGFQVFEHSGATPTPHSTFKLRYAHHKHTSLTSIYTHILC